MNVPLDKDSVTDRGDTVKLYGRLQCLRINEVYIQDTESVHEILSTNGRVSVLALTTFDKCYSV